MYYVKSNLKVFNEHLQCNKNYETNCTHYLGISRMFISNRIRNEVLNEYTWGIGYVDSNIIQ